MNHTRKEFIRGDLRDVLRRLMDIMNRFQWRPTDTVDLRNLTRDAMQDLHFNGWKLLDAPH